MTGGRIIEPNGPNSPGDSYNPFQSFSTLSEGFEAAVSVTFDDPDAFIEEIIQGVLEMPPEERFKKSADLLEEKLIEKFGSTEAFGALLPLDQEWIDQFLNQMFSRAMNDISQTAFYNRDGADWVILLAALNTCKHGFSRLDEVDLGEEERREVASSLLSLYFRLYREIKREKEAGEGDFQIVAKDVLRAQDVILPKIGIENGLPSANEVSDSEAYRFVRQEGAVLCYKRVEISLGRGGELAGLSESHFKQVLESYGEKPFYGPDSSEELNSGPDLDNV